MPASLYSGFPMKVFIATPCYDGRVDAFCAAAIMRELSILREADIDALWFPLCGCCYLPVARNKLVREFLATDCTDLVFVDSDVYFEPGAMLKLLLPVGKEVVAGIYPLKREPEDYPVWIKTEDGRPVVADDGLIEAWGVPTGFLRIRRSALDLMLGEGRVRECVEYDAYGNEEGRYWAFFDTGFLDPDMPTKWWGEDYWFSWVWTAHMHMKAWVVPDISFHHVGMKSWEGNYHRYLQRLPGGSLA